MPPTDKPVIFVPGIMGSVMKGPSAIGITQYWTNFLPTGNPNIPSVKNLTLNQSSNYYQNGIFPTDTIRSILGQPFYQPLLTNLQSIGFTPEYDVNRHFEQGLGCDYSLKNSDPTQPPNVRLFVFPYDWRRDLNQTAITFRSYVRCVQQLYPPGTRVNVVAHSMGGLLVRRYILQTQQSGEPHRLGKVVTIASPFLGAADSTNRLYTGGPFFDSLTIAATPSSIQFLSEHFPSIHQLLPSRKYREFRKGIIVEQGDVDGNGVSNERYGFDRIVQLLNADFPTSLPGSMGRDFHDFAGQDDWRNDHSGIKYFHVLGQQSKLLTTDALYVKWSALCRRSGNRLTGCFKNRMYKPIKGLGDGTVSTLSTAFGWNNDPTFPTTDLAPPGMRVFVRNSRSSSTDDAADHTKITRDARVRDLISYFLGVSHVPTLDGDLFERSRPSSLAHKNGSIPSISSPAHYLTLSGQTAVAIADQFGNTAAIEDGFLRNDVPGLSAYEMIGANSVMLILATDSSYAVEFRVGDTPIELELLTGIGNETPSVAFRYKDLDLPINTPVKLTISISGFAELRVDTDNNGSFETIISPTASLSGNSANDTEPPIVHIDAIAGEGNIATIIINSDDSGSGVYNTWYSTNGVDFDEYTGTFQIPVTSNPVTIEAFADDNAANRSGLVRRTISLSPTVVPVAECISLGPEGYTARFGYHNQTQSLVSVPIGLDNTFFPPPGDLGQVTEFQLGSVSNAFTVRMHKKTINWRLRGNDGLLRIATASKAATPICQ